MRLWFTRLAAAIVVIAGPALLLYVAADIYSRYPLGREGWPFPLNFQLAAACGYALAIGLVSAQYGALRTLVAVIGCIVVPILTAIVTIPLMFGLTAGGPPTWAWAAWMALFAVPTALWQVLVLRDRHNARLLQIAAHLTLAGGVFLITDWLFSRDQRFLSTWPALLAVLPFIALAMRGAVPQAAWRPAVALLLALLPIYAAKTMIDARSETMARAAMWPLRVYSDYISPTERNALVKKVTTIRPGIPIRIGEHWYRFERIGLQNPRPDPARRPDRISWLQLDIPAEDLDLREIAYREHVQLNIVVDSDNEITRKTIASIEKNPLYVKLREGDLHIYVVVRRDSPADHNIVREKIRRFIRAARVDPPAS